MGMEKTVTFEKNTCLDWAALRDFLQRRGFPVQVRMIDGDLAFPDDAPPATWRELRLGTPQGMVTLRRDNNRIAFVTWGNADAALLQAWNALIWAVAEFGDGRVDSSQGPCTPAEFRQTADLPAALRGEP